MYVAPITSQSIYYNPSARINRQNLYAAKNNKTYTTVTFKRIKDRINTIAPSIGCALGSILFILSGLTFCHKEKENQIYAGRDREYYYNLDKNYIDSIAKGLNDTITPMQEEQRNRLIEKKDTVLKDFQYETQERDDLERIYLGQIDSITLPSSSSGKKITYYEEEQATMNLADSIKAKYPNINKKED